MHWFRPNDVASTAARHAVIASGAILAAGGLVYVLIDTGVLPNPFGPKPPPGTPIIVPWPTTRAKAEQAIVELDALWFENQGNQNYQAQLHQEAQAIRSVFPGVGPQPPNPQGPGYTCQQLVQMGALNPAYCQSSS